MAKSVVGCALVLAVGMAGCAPTLSQNAAKIQTVEKADNCESVGEFTGSSGFNGWFFPAEERAKAEAQEAAAEAGATHLRWIKTDEGFMGGDAVAEGYRCK